MATDLPGTGGDTPPADYNVAPTKPVRAIVNRPLRDARGTPADEPTRQLRVVSWGLVPSWAKDRSIAAKLINARVESVAGKPAFRRAYAKRRCLLPADGWYEWQLRDTDEGPRKQPMYMTPTDGHGIDELRRRLAELLPSADELDAPREPAGVVVHRIEGMRDGFSVEREEDGVFRVRGKRIERIAAQTNFDVEESAERFQRDLARYGIDDELRRSGVIPGDLVRFGPIELEWEAQPWEER